MSNLKNLHWVSIHHPLTYEEVKKVEHVLNVSLPEDYCSIIGRINGGALKDAFVEEPLKQRICYTRNVSLSRSDRANIFMLYTPDSELNNRYFPFGSVGNGDYFCFDLTMHNVVLWQHENDRCVYICETFSELLNMIQED